MHALKGTCNACMKGTLQCMLERDCAMHAWKGPCNACLKETVQCLLERDRAMHAWNGPFNLCLKETVQCMLKRDRAMHAWKGPCNVCLKGTVQCMLERAVQYMIERDRAMHAERDRAMHAWKGPCNACLKGTACNATSFDQWHGRYRRFSRFNSISFWFPPCSSSRNVQFTFVEKPQWKIFSYQNYKLIRYQRKLSKLALASLNFVIICIIVCANFKFKHFLFVDYIFVLL